LKDKSKSKLRKIMKVTYQHEYDFEIHCASVTLKNTKTISQTKTSRRSFKEKGKTGRLFYPRADERMIKNYKPAKKVKAWP
jgi:peptide subunit release factor 1 (eRF1)